MLPDKTTIKREYRLNLDDLGLVFDEKIISVELYMDNDNKQRVGIITEGPR